MAKTNTLTRIRQDLTPKRDTTPLNPFLGYTFSSREIIALIMKRCNHVLKIIPCLMGKTKASLIGSRIARSSVSAATILILISFLPFVAHAAKCSDLELGEELIISAVLYDPPGPDKGKEWIELYNPTDRTIYLSAYSIEHGDGAKPDAWSFVWSGDDHQFIGPYQHFLIGDSDVVPIPDAYQSLVMQNGPDGIRLIKEGTMIDQVGWGNHIYEEYYLGSPTRNAKDVALRRYHERVSCSDDEQEKAITAYAYKNTFNNSGDFDVCSDLPHSQFSYQGIPIIFSVKDTSITVASLSIINDRGVAKEKTSGHIKIMPYPGKSREFTFEAVINSSVDCSSQLEVRFSSTMLNERLVSEDILDTVISLSQTDGRLCRYSHKVSLPFTLEPDIYDMTIEVKSPYQTIQESLSFEYLSLVAFDIDTPSINFGENTRSSEAFISGDDDMSTPSRPTIRNIGNQPINLMAKTIAYPLPTQQAEPSSYEMISASGGIGSIGNLTQISVSFDAVSNDVEPKDLGWTVLSDSLTLFAVRLASDQAIPFSLRLSLSPEIEHGNYAYGIMMLATRDTEELIEDT